ncbi:MAG: methyltransferase [Bacteroidetes bacterium]|nr:methyltransferase [Bacteroidota bacterium]
MSADFQCKQFLISQRNSAMKVGTDSMLLGSWADFSFCHNLLDIGTGTGLLSLMIAQRFPEIRITAIENDAGAANDAELNFYRSVFSDRIQLIRADASHWRSDTILFDAIICNPPYFTNGPEAGNAQRHQARNACHFNEEDLVRIIDSSCSDALKIALVLPVDRFQSYSKSLDSAGLKIVGIMKIHPKQGKTESRYLAQWGRNYTGEPIIDSLNIRDSTNQYSSAYKKLTEDFYLGLG